MVFVFLTTLNTPISTEIILLFVEESQWSTSNACKTLTTALLNTSSISVTRGRESGQWDAECNDTSAQLCFICWWIRQSSLWKTRCSWRSVNSWVRRKLLAPVGKWIHSKRTTGRYTSRGSRFQCWFEVLQVCFKFYSFLVPDFQHLKTARPCSSIAILDLKS